MRPGDEVLITALRATSYKLQAASCELRAASYKLQATGYKLQVSSCKLQATSYKLQATSYKLQAISYKLQATGPYGLAAAGVVPHDGGVATVAALALSFSMNFVACSL